MELLRHMLVLATFLIASSVHAQPSEIFEYVSSLWGVTEQQANTVRVVNRPIPLGAMEKRDGIWRPEATMPFTGTVTRVTWQVEDQLVVDLFTSIEERLVAGGGEKRYGCIARSCGNASEWASKVYRQRLLYGRDEFMRYGAFRYDDGSWVTVFSAARTASRQYLHIDFYRLNVSEP
jgi:hypothetical protein